MRLQDLTGNQYGRWTVLKYAGDSKWLCQCSCGNIKRIAGTTLKNGDSKSCGCYRKEAVSRCKCKCGNETTVFSSNLKRGHTLSCGCIGASLGENNVDQILKLFHVKFEREYHFDDLISLNGGYLLFDFAIKDKDDQLIGLIEYQGIQHEKAMPNDPYFGQYQREYSDNAKREYCKAHNIPLFEIWYDENIVNTLGKILKTMYKDHADSVPSISEDMKV